jgi:quercetin dioxygenase-like cupin family protein
MNIGAIVLAFAATAGAQDTGVLRRLAESRFAPLAAMPTCVTMAVESGDPTKGASVIVFKATAGCSIPWHWHTPTEQVMIVSGSAKVEMKDSGKSAVLGPGGFALMPSKHVHQFTCTTSCSAFVSSDTTVHYVDRNGDEIRRTPL